MEIIREKACECIRVDEIAEMLEVSRSVLNVASEPHLAEAYTTSATTATANGSTTFARFESADVRRRRAIGFKHVEYMNSVFRSIAASLRRAIDVKANQSRKNLNVNSFGKGKSQLRKA